MRSSATRRDCSRPWWRRAPRLWRPRSTRCRAIGRSYLHLILQPKRVALYRLVAGESGRCPHLGDIFYRTGPQAVTTRVAEFFRAAAAHGQLETDDPEQLAHFFVHALRGDHHNRVLFNPTRMPTAQEIDRHIDFIVRTLLRCCRPIAPTET
jgi:TetR/AcrR family transcriptional regulator, mexJK operon transcriptional repressor